MSQHNHKRGVRQVCVIQGPRSFGLEAVRTLDHSACRALWLGDAPPDGWESLPAGKVRQKLGQELDLLVFDGHSGFDVDAFAAICGCLCGGGLLVLLLPDPDGFLDPYLSRISAHPERFHHRFIHRFIALLRQQPFSWIEPGQPMPAWSAPAGGGESGPLQLTPDQTRALADLQRTGLGRGRRPLVMIADRGRGKSTVLGLAAAELLQQGLRHILITAPRVEMVQALFDQAQGALADGQRDGWSLRLGESCMQFIPPDELLRSGPEADLLLVDEAAAIPAALLEGLLRRYNRIAFATTVHGYEGTGRGFVLRFSQRLDQLTPSWRRCLLQEPVRWDEQDPLEGFLFRALLLDAEADRASAQPDIQPCERLDAAYLANNEEPLRQLQGLLLSAHYQTRPSDLRRLLDDPDLDGWVIRCAEVPVAVALCIREGGFDAQLSVEIGRGQRRPQGHLLPQTLAFHGGYPEAARLTYRRIMRIAVHPDWRRQGLGLSLLRQIEAQSRAEGFDCIGSSFGATAELLPFWLDAGFRPVRLGMRRDGASGQHSVVMLRGLSASAQASQEHWQQRFDEQLPYLLADPLRDLEAEIAIELFHGDAHQPQLSQQDWQDLHAFARASRDYAAARLALWRGCGVAAVSGLDAELLKPLILKVLQGRDWAEVAALLQLPGKAQVLQAMRRAVEALITLRKPEL